MKLVLFDVDGTLVDGQHMICAAVHQAYDDHGLPRPERARVLSIIGLSLPDAFARLANGAVHPLDDLVASYKNAFFALRARPDSMENLYPGARETVLALAKRPDIVLGVATGKSRRGVETVLGHYDLLEHFSCFETADSAPSKPDPGMVLNALRDTGARASETVVIGDSIYDMEMAKAAGVTAIGVAWGYHPVGDLRSAGADTVIDNFSALVPTLDALWTSRAQVHA